MKTARELFTQHLPPEVAEKAIANSRTPEEKYRAAYIALTRSFTWSNSKEGYYYWDDHWYNLRKDRL